MDAESLKALRIAAEKLSQNSAIDLAQFSSEDLQMLLHELSVHQIELEMQNDELMRAQEALEVSSRNFFQLYHYAPVGYLRINENFRIVQSNQLFQNWVGKTGERIQGLKLEEFVRPEYRLMISEWLRQWNEIPETIHFELKTPAIRSMHVRATIAAHTLSSTEPAWLMALTDITALKEAEDELILASTVFNAASEGCVVTDADGQILIVNKAFTNITGFTQAEAEGKNPSLRKSGRQNQSFYRDFWHELNTRGHWEGEIWNRRKNGEIYPEHLSVTAVLNAQGTPYRYVGVFSDITKTKKQEELIHWQATRDALTSLLNRSSASDQLRRAIVRAERDRQHVAAMLLDLDGFKEVNDTLGHDAGDSLLKDVAQRLAASVREGDIVARLGGDEFLVLLEDIDPSSGALNHLASKILESIALPYQIGTDSVYVTGSLGLAFYPDDARSEVELQKRADQAMYAAKQQGRNRFCYFMPEMQYAVEMRRVLANELRTGLQHEQFTIHYQPIIRLSDQTIAKAEALMRWQHPTRGLVMPDEFIPVAEDSGFINPLGDWLLNQVMTDIVHWRAAGYIMPQISINVSSIQLNNRHHPDGLLSITHTLREHQLTDFVAIELTERLLIDHSALVDERLLALRDAGIQVALDDFGTGHSCLAYLQKFHIDYLKIDKSFVQRMTPDSQSHALCEAMIVMAHKLGMRVIAEGVETPQQQDWLLQMGCDYAQGYLYSKPQSVPEFERLLAKNNRA